MEEVEHEQLEIARLEQALLQAEYVYKNDTSLLQQALIRCRRIENLHLLGLHLKFRPILKKIRTLPVQYLFYRWKSRCSIDRTNRIKKVAKLLKHIYKKIMTRGFVIFRERGNRLQMEKLFNPGYRDFMDKFQDS
ncbi:hypothetical protein SteCoe_17265 [Stentor coeruleus]|uniref:Uncharacterized protein n=1 Tax=Stentor coeruleus TaxID=5963 RepID=A0A1R2BZ84_9CILI|nr:hypothetical protein SteCoe_17265 [Stentor coeruleus]